MHELSIAQNIIDAVQTALPEHGLTRVERIGVRIGTLSSVDPEALTFGYQALIAETSLAGSVLAIEMIETRARCRRCREEFVATDFVFVCPKCESSQCDLVSGQELEIVYLEGE
ncbi:MAG: hydrogenase maturation nickel metallochaperone HypA [candidate division Zixibacteria bacterium]|nr:hydrogenase maturation nickel metallochaperone HypA [candidate division Zixibacteria bacterium]